MKDKTHDMNRGYSTEEAECGYDKIPNGEMASSWDRKKRQLDWANLDDNQAMLRVENLEVRDEDYDIKGGFLPRNNYEDRF